MKKVYTMTLRLEISLEAQDERELNQIFTGLDVGDLKNHASVVGYAFKEVEDAEAQDEEGNYVRIK